MTHRKQVLDRARQTCVSAAQPTLPWRNRAKASGGQPAAENLIGRRRCASYARQTEALANKPSVAPILTGSYRWYCWFGAPGTEYRVYLELLDAGHPVYLPHVLEYPHERMFQPTIRLAFPKYGFVGLDSANEDWPSPTGSVAWRLMVRKFLTASGDLVVRPIAIAQGVIERLQGLGRPSDGIIVPERLPKESDWERKRRLQRDFEQSLGNTAALPVIEPGSAIRVVDGAFQDFEGKCISSDDDELIAMLSLFGRETPVTMPRAAVERA